MKKHIGLAVAVAALLAAPAFAQGSAGSGAAGASTGKPVPESVGANVDTRTGAQGAAATGGQVSSGTGIGVTSGTGAVVAPTHAAASVAPSASVRVDPAAHGVRLLPGGAMVQQESTTTLGGPGAGVSGSQTVVTRHWINVPANVTHRGDFQRWMALQ